MANRIRNSLLTIAVSVFLTVQSFAQSEIRISGSIFDQVNGEIPKAKIQFKSKGMRKTVYSDQEGKIELTLPKGIYTITSSFTGCKTSTQKNWLVDETRPELVLNIRLMCKPTPIL